MTGSIPSYRYRMSGLNVASDIALPMRRALDAEGTFAADVTLHVGEVPERLEQPTHRGANWAVQGKRFLLNLPGIGRFLSEDGCRLTLCPAIDMPLDDILVFATGTALAAILYQRGAMLLHASAVTHKGRAFLFCGQSGAGKSTLAGVLGRTGCGFLTDDVSSVVRSDDGPPLILSDGRALRLYADSIGHIGLAVGPRVRSRLDKFHVAPPAGSEGPQSIPLSAIYMLADSNAAAPPGISSLPPLASAQALLRHTYRRRLALAYSSQGQLAARTAEILSRVPVFHLRRPRDFSRLDETVTMLRTHWNGLL
jgi:hypothetical protein